MELSKIVSVKYAEFKYGTFLCESMYYELWLDIFKVVQDNIFRRHFIIYDNIGIAVSLLYYFTY